MKIMKQPYQINDSGSVGGGGSLTVSKWCQSKDESVPRTIFVALSIYVENARYILCCTVTPSRRESFTFSNKANEATAKEVLKLVQEMISANQNNFTNMLAKLSITPSNICESFKGIADEVLLKDKTGVTWARIGILYAFGSSMAKHSMPRLPKEQDPSQFIDHFAECVGKHIELRTGSWVEEQGGWSSLSIEHDRPVGEYILTAVEVGAAVLGAIFTVVGLGSSSSAITSFLSR